MVHWRVLNVDGFVNYMAILRTLYSMFILDQHFQSKLLKSFNLSKEEVKDE